MKLTSYTTCTSIFKIFCKYWPYDGLLRPKLVANNRNNKKIVLSDGVYILIHFNIIHKVLTTTAILHVVLHFATKPCLYYCNYYCVAVSGFKSELLKAIQRTGPTTKTVSLWSPYWIARSV